MKEKRRGWKTSYLETFLPLLSAHTHTRIVIFILNDVFLFFDTYLSTNSKLVVLCVACVTLI